VPTSDPVQQPVVNPVQEPVVAPVADQPVSPMPEQVVQEPVSPVATPEPQSEGISAPMSSVPEEGGSDMGGGVPPTQTA